MKKVLTITALVLLISLSLIAGTLAMYVVEIDDLAEGSVVAKEFILEEGVTNTFSDDVKIAPSETVEWKFSVKNYDGQTISETAMDLEFAIELTAADGKSAITPLKVTVFDENNNPVETTTEGATTYTFADEFELKDEGQEKTYTVAINWPDGENDIDYAGADFGTALAVSVTGTQK
ncbi:MAG: hypothetical protein ACOX30_07000 [Dethiobacteria bacterium]|jgi:uncharacterized GH25 family protein